MLIQFFKQIVASPLILTNMNQTSAWLTFLILVYSHLLLAQPSVKVIDAIKRNDVNELIYWIKNSDVDNRFLDDSGDNHLHVAAKRGNIEIVRTLLNEGWDVNYPNESGNTALHDAADKNELEMVNFLIRSGANINAKNQYGNTPLYYAAGTRNLKLVKLLIENGADVNSFRALSRFRLARGKSGDTLAVEVISLPIFEAISNGDDQTASLLIDAGASVELMKQDPYIFWVAAENGAAVTIQKLIKAGFNVNFIIGQTSPLAQASDKRHLEIVDLLLRNEADPNLRHDPYSVIGPIGAAIPYGEPELSGGAKDTITLIVKRLIDSKADFSLYDFEQAIRNKLEEVAILFLAHGLDIREERVTTYSGYDQNYLALALKNDCFELAKRILEKNTRAQINNADREGATSLMWAVYKNQVDIVKALIGKGADPNKKGVIWLNREHTSYYGTPLCIAAGMGNLEMVKFLLNSGAKIDEKEVDDKGAIGWAPVFWSACNGHIDVSKYLIERKAIITGTDASGGSLLHYASFGGDTALVNFLLDRKFNVNAIDEKGNAPIHFSTANGKVQASLLLLKKGADINKRNKNGYSALTNCYVTGSVEMVEILNKSVVVDEVVTKDGQTPLMVACRNKNIQVANYLLDKGANAHLVDKTDHSVLFNAVESGDTTILKRVLHGNKNINKPCGHNKTPLQLALESKDSAAMSLLLKFGASPDVLMNDEDKTPILVAALRRDKHVFARLLLESKADLFIKDSEGRTTLDILLEDNNHPDLIRIVIETYPPALFSHLDAVTLRKLLSGCDRKTAEAFMLRLVTTVSSDAAIVNTALRLASSFGFYEAAGILAKKTKKINDVDNEGNTPLHIACENGYLDIVKVLCQIGAGVDTKNSNGDTPLILACKNGFLDIARLLVTNKANVNTVNNERYSALFYASSNGYGKLTSFLCSAGADVNAFNRLGSTIFHAVCKNGHENVATILLQHGVITNAKDNLGRMPLFYAINNNHPGIIRLLVHGKRTESIKDAVEMVNTSIKTENIAMTEMLISIYADSLKHSLDFLLETAVKFNNPSAIQYLVTQGANKNLSCMVDGDRINLIAYAIKFGHDDLARFLIAQKADVIANGFNNWPPLLLAVDNRNIVLARLLIDNGAGVNMKTDLDYDGIYTPLLIAVENDDIEMIKLLLSKGADSHFKTSRGLSITEFAKNIKSVEIVKLLENGNKE